ncbi:BamA/TamA family outer membrane protein [Flammeovirgaceae bacterium SG7u.111]|nr:BamA/TamA family outer membrane protein [Flammeovirgaceae bacterium SG7u.132]WPO38143.1 BamA/TamA family outer membrane protein [Flammeovirgaceae bacterium SG7u.111]
MLREELTPTPNLKILGSRPLAWLYNILPEPKKKNSFVNFLKEKIGSKPVLLENITPGRVKLNLERKLYNNGYLLNKASFEIVEKEKTGKVVYTVELKRPYFFNEIHYPSDSTSITEEISLTQQGTTLLKGQQFNMDALSEELIRIEKLIKDKGYYYFNADFMHYKVDTTVGNNHLANVYLSLKKDVPEQAKEIYTLGDTYVNPEYQLNEINEDTIEASYSIDTLQLGSYKYIRKSDMFRPEIILDNVFLEKGSIYKRSEHTRTIDRLNGLQTFSFVNVRFAQPDSSNNMDTYIMLVPQKSKSLSAELGLVAKSNSFAGPGLQLNYRSRNLMGGGEMLNLGFGSSFETQYGGNVEDNVNSIGLNFTASLTIPRFITPFKITSLSKNYVPNTQIKASLERLIRTNLFSMTSFTTSFGYRWRETITTTHEFNPLSISSVVLGETTDKFRELLEENPLLKRTYEEQFIIGSNYVYNYTNQLEKNSGTSFFFEGRIDLSGNLLYMVQSAISDTEPSPNNPFSIFGTPYSQFVKLSVDPRYYFSINERNKLVTRLFAGVAAPIGNSSTIPYVKQYYAGGNNSIRAFRARSLGPGSYVVPDSLLYKIDLTGDIKLEANVEYRFDIYSMIKGAVFVDAGNIWLYNAADERNGANFTSDFYKEIALGTGFGLRLDASLFVLRFDLAFPLRNPARAEYDRWEIKEINPLDKDWRKDNLILNIAIGYPF